jgi:hypothetical protein
MNPLLPDVVRQEDAMSIDNTPELNVPVSIAAESRPVMGMASPSLAWRRAAIVLAIAGQVITVSALASADPLSVSWAALLLAISPAPLAALAALAPPQLVRPATLTALVVLVVGMVGGVTHTGLFFIPELIVLTVGTATAWREG